ncbi:hypothetical protein FACS189454_00800 [Planctomycetales bacterium]|nr:hypothetical protein FACS189454_00800 [Planctomycetales bacterium]
MDGFVGSSFALSIAGIATRGNKPVLVIAENKQKAEILADDIETFLKIPNHADNTSENIADNNIATAVFLPLKEKSFAKAEDGDAVEVEEKHFALLDKEWGSRIHVLKELIQPAKRLVIVSSLDAVSQFVPSKELLIERTKTLSVGAKIDIEELRYFLVECGYENMPAVDLPCEFAVRGFILDVFAPDWDEPARIELFGDEIESIRYFDVATQRSLKKLSTISITKILPDEIENITLFDYLPNDSPIILVEPESFAVS